MDKYLKKTILIILLLIFSCVEHKFFFRVSPDGKYEVFGSMPAGKLNLPIDEYYSLMNKLWDKMRESLLTDIFITGANAVSKYVDDKHGVNAADETAPTITGPSNNQTSGTSAGITGSTITITENGAKILTT